MLKTGARLLALAPFPIPFLFLVFPSPTLPIVGACSFWPYSFAPIIPCLLAMRSHSGGPVVSKTLHSENGTSSKKNFSVNIEILNHFVIELTFLRL